MYFIVLLPFFIFVWFIFSRFVFCRKVDSKPLLFFCVLFIASLISGEIVLGNPFAWLRFTPPVNLESIKLSGYLQHGISLLLGGVYLFHKRSYKPKDIAVAITLWVTANTVFIVAMIINARIDYPFNLEWMEGTMVDHVVVIQQGGPLYREPSWHFIPFLYGPLFYRIVALFPYVAESPFIVGRMVSLAMTGSTVLLLFFSVAAETKNSWIGLIVSLAFFASFRVVAQWFDIYRTDMLFQFLLLLGGVLLWRRPDSIGAIAAAGVALALSVFTKQPAALGVLFFSGWFLYVHGWKRTLLLVGFGAAAGIALLIYELLDSGRIFFHYFYDMLSIRPPHIRDFRLFFINVDLLGLPLVLITFIAVDALISAFRRQPLRQWLKSFSLWTFVSFVMITLLSRSKSGAAGNCVIPMCIGVLMGVGMWFRERLILPGPSDIYPGILMMLVYMTFMDPLSEQTVGSIPNHLNLTAEEKIVKYVSSRPGAVWIPSHTHTCYMAKGQLCFNTIALDDWMMLTKKIPRKIVHGITKHEVQTIVFDHNVLPWFTEPMRRELRSAYECKDNGLDLRPPNAAIPYTGYRTYVSKICELKPVNKRAK